MGVDKEEGRRRVLERLNQALNHLEDRLDQDAIDMAEVARIAAVPEYHFRRLFSALAGMSLPTYVRRRRMTLAGTWAVFDDHGPCPSAVQELWRDVFTLWFPSNPYTSRPGPELLRTRPVDVGSATDFQLWIPVERTLRPSRLPSNA